VNKHRRGDFRLSTERIWRNKHTTADIVKSAVSDWSEAMEFFSLTEIGGIVDGRLDLLLIPMGIRCPMFKGMGAVVGKAWQCDWTERCGLAAVEVKVDRTDFVNGLSKGQFERYEKEVCGLYIAGPPDVVRIKDVPSQYGVLHFGSDLNGSRLVCRRHPKWVRKTLSDSQMWRIVWAIQKQIRRERRELRERDGALERKIKEHAGRAIWSALKSIKDGQGEMF
jgi:hypothetical protein